ncbi:hypothetical protein ABW19_dt0206851 [Dactylella cylindrospora]|nr:hypothetical protein ABW19_dt0206851 [Dactylella cylindrospora]
MLPKNYKSSYWSYKVDTVSIAEWLARTAEKHGYPVDSLAKPTGPRLKGRARKEAKARVLKEYVISIADFVKLAEFIVSVKDPVVSVPAQFFHLLEEVIIRRQKVNDVCFAATADDANRARHHHFVVQLQRVRDILGPRRRQTSNIPDDDAFIKIWRDQLQDPGIKKLQEQYKVAGSDDQEERYLASYFLIMDTIYIRGYLKSLWSCYKQGLIDIMVVSTVTNTAVDLVRRIEEEFDQNFPTHGNYEEKIAFYFSAESHTIGVDPDERVPGDPFNIELYDAADKVMLPCFSMIEAFSRMWLEREPGNFPDLKKGYFGEYKSENNRTNMSNRDRFTEDKTVLGEILPDLFLLAEREPDFADDEVTKAARLVSQQKYPFWAVFAFQMLLDINYQLRESLFLPFHDLRQQVDSIKRTIDKHSTFHNNPNTRNLFNIYNGAFGYVKKFIHHVAEDDVISRLTNGSTEAFRLLKRHPLRCGILILAIRGELQRHSINFTNSSGAIIQTCDLYKFLSKKGLLRRHWTDLELVVRLHSHVIEFAKPLLTAIGDHFRRVPVSQGDPATSPTARQRENITQIPSATIEMEQLLPVSNIFIGQLWHKRDKLMLTPQNINDIIIKEFPPLAETIPDQRPDRVFLYANIGVKDTESLWKKWGNITPLQFLGNIATSMETEVSVLLFDYLEAHRNCWKILLDINSRCSQTLEAVVGSRYIEADHQLPWISVYIRLATNEVEETGEVRYLYEVDGQSPRLLEDVAEYFNMISESESPVLL